ncbi:MAG: MFS transporter [Bacteroidetes bacterium]|nr:MAG: MFS transporter [Bacteroidota bacterium]
MKNRTAFGLLIVANFISGCAQGITMLAIPWYFVNIIQKPSEFGLLYASVTLLSVFWSLYSGTFIDRYNRKKIFQVITFFGFVFLMINGLLAKHLDSYAYLFAALVFTFTMFNYQIHYPTLYALGQQITEKENYTKINSLIEIQGQAANIAAGALGAVLLTGVNQETLLFFGLQNMDLTFEKWTLSEVFMLDGITYLLAFAIIGFIQYTPVQQLEIDKSPIINRLKNGIKYLKHHPGIFRFGLYSYSVFVFLLVEVHLLLPLYVEKHLNRGAETFALADLIYSLGALASGVLVNKIIQPKNERNAIFNLMVMLSVVLFLVAMSKSLWIFVLFNLALGLSNAGVRILRVSYLFNHVPNNVIGRVSSIFHVTNVILRFVFILLFSLPFFSKGNNVIYGYITGAVFILISAVLLRCSKDKNEYGN